MNAEMAKLWDITAFIRTASAMILYGLFLGRFLTSFSVNGQAPGRTAGIIYTSVILTCLLVPFEMEASTAYLAASTGAFLAYILMEHGRTLIKLFACLTFEAVRCISSTVGSGVYILSSSRLVWPLHVDPELQFHMFILVCVLEVVCESAVAYLSLRAIVHFFPNPHGALRAGEFGLLCAPSAVAIASTQVLHGLRQILDYGKFSVDVESFALVQALVVLISVIATVIMFSRVRSEQHSETSRKLLEEQLSSMRGHIAQMERNDARMARLRHDAANHLETISALQARGELEGASAYAKRTYDELSRAQSGIHTGNPVSDVILNEQQSLAAQRGVRYSTSFRFPSSLSIDAFDLGIILHNAGRNAIEGALGSDDPWVQVRSSVHRQTLLIEVTNSCNGTVLCDPATGLPRSNRSGEHGIGMRNIQSAAQKYSGTVRAECEPGIFSLIVLMCSPPPSATEKDPSAPSSSPYLETDRY